ncbi:putative DNA glycosylase [Rosa chinensis]|uniref:Putative DNA glycosylase n=1 Tax=Rosa chinensis TaxID=74649 RepID=A0A2P6SM39_ROSCH|nr:putative DNA glycosylase [Rosa chinensis]
MMQQLALGGECNLGRGKVLSFNGFASVGFDAFGILTCWLSILNEKDWNFEVFKDLCMFLEILGVLAADSQSLESAIRCGGLAKTKAFCIKNMLSCLLEKKEKICLEYLRDLSVDEIKVKLSHFKGIGPKTVNLCY